jgi:hypothetical protein
VKFRIKPVLGLPVGTVIENRATVVMYNRQPGVTNVYHHTIGGDTESDYLIIDWVDSPETDGLSKVVAYPNPSAGEVHFDLGPTPLKDVTYEILDLSGKLLLTKSFESAQMLTVDHPHLPPGTYLFRIKTEENRVGSGKLMILR